MTPIEPTPFRVALRNQLWLVSRNKRRTSTWGTVLGLGVLLAAAFATRVPVLHGSPVEGGGTTLRFEWFSETDFGLPDAPGLLAAFLGFGIVLLVGVWRPFVLWADEPPRHRGYHWRMPITRWKHDLARIVAGASALAIAMLGVALAVVVGLLMGGRGSALQELDGPAALNLVSGPLTLYLFASAAAIASNRPGRMFLVIWLSITGLYIFSGIVDVPVLYDILHEIAGGPYSYATALVGGFVVALTPAASTPAASTSVGSAWSLAATLWLLIAAGVVAWTLSRRRAM